MPQGLLEQEVLGVSSLASAAHARDADVFRKNKVTLVSAPRMT